MHHPKLFAALFLSLLPAFEVYWVAAGVTSVDPGHLGFLAFLVFAIIIYAILALREGARELRALRTAYERNVPQPGGASPLLRARPLPHVAERAELQGDPGEARTGNTAPEPVPPPKPPAGRRRALARKRRR
jgi:hypothetical protein